MRASWIALLRLARRDVRRHRGAALLAVLLIAAPIAGLVAAATVQATVTPTIDERARQAFGAGDLAAYTVDGTTDVDAVTTRLVDGARVTPVWRGDLSLGADDTPVPAVGVDLDGLGAGLFEVLRGRAPRPGRAEVALTREGMRDVGATVGAIVAGTDEPMTVVGLLRDPLQLDRRAAVTTVDAAARPATGVIVDLPDGVEPATTANRLERAGWDVTVRDDIAADDDVRMLILLFGGFGFVVTVLVTAAAFAVSTQRRRRDLALLAAAGGEPRHLRRSVLATALISGAAGAVLGVAAGLAVAAAALPWLEELSNQAVAGLRIAPGLIAAAGISGIVTALAAAWLSARSAARTPVAAALADHLPARTSSRRVLAAGAGSVLAGLAGTAWVTDAGTRSEAATAAGLLVSTALVMVGLGAASPWLLERVTEAIGHRVPIGTRLALRDAVRLRSRTAPVIVAVVAGLGLSIAIGATVELMQQGLTTEYRPVLRDDQVLVDGPAAVPLVRELRDRLPVTDAARLRTVQPAPAGQEPLPLVVAVADRALLDALDAPPDAMRALASGQALVLQDDDGPVDDDEAVARAHELAPAGVRTVDLPLAPTMIPSVAVSAETLDRLGGRPVVDRARWLLTLDGPVDPGQRELARRLAETAGQRVIVETGPPSIDAGVIQSAALVGAGLVSILIVTIGLALVAAETRRDAALLAVVGAAPRTRRGLAAARAGVLTLIGGVLAVPAGLLPIWGLAASAGEGAAFTVPWASVAAVVLVVPGAAAATAWVFGRSDRDGRHRTMPA